MRDGPRGFRQSFTCSALLRNPLRVRIVFVYASVTLCGSPFQRIRLTTGLVTLLLQTLQPPGHRNVSGLGYVRFRSPLLSESRFLYFPSGTEMVHFPEFALSRLCIQRVVLWVCHSGFPHSEISGSTPVCGFPKLIAACHVLHRLILPRHPPCALSSLIIKLTPRRS